MYNYVVLCYERLRGTISERRIRVLILPPEEFKVKVVKGNNEGPGQSI